jgi:hypothetical protein
MGIVKKKFIFVTDIIFRKEHIMNKIYIVLIVGVIILSGIGTVALTDNSTYDVKNLKESFVISEPIIKDVDQYVTVNLEEATSSLLHVGKPVLPVVTRVFTLPFGSKISHVDVIFSEENEIAVSKEVLPGSEPVFVSTESKSLKKTVKDPVVYGNAELYPFSRYSYTTRAGLENKEHVNYLTVRCYPVRYSPKQNIIYYSENVEINVLYKEPSIPTVFPNEYNLVIIAPEEYSAGIQPLVSHKESHNIKTLFKTTEDIYSEYTGRDEPEKIKYFIKEAIENFGASYVLLIGSIYKLPIRTSSVTIWDRWQEDTLTDLYYSDVLDANGDFSSWDSNDNNIFGETGKDQLDLFPDVHIGRLACDEIKEVETVVDKIIHYEDETFYQDWFHDMIFIGGNTFQWNPGNEGEEINEMIMDIMSDFNPSSVIWTSKGNFNRKTISGAINEGAGFLDYSGHGFEHGMGTYPPNGLYLRTYLTLYIEDLENGYELPIIFFDACLTAKLDFVLQDILDYKQYRIFDILAKILDYNTSLRLPCYAWYFVKHEGGGAIATIGATRTAFGGVDSGAGKMSIEFFKTYKSSEMLGQMMTKAQNAYITDVPSDEFTVEEFTLLGDPSLKLGGYP